MDKSLAQSTISKRKPASKFSSSEGENDCDKKCKKPRNYKIRAFFLGNWKMDYLASPIPDLFKPQCLICYEILSENKKFSVKRHYLSKHSTSIENKFPINSEQLKKYRNTRTKIKKNSESL